MEEDHIESIHNYCDRWCERCPFVDRCAVGVAEKKRWAENASDEALWREVHQNFQQALQLLDRMIREAGLDPGEIDSQPAPEPNPDIEALQKHLRQKGGDYFKAVNQFLQRHDAFLTEHSAETEQPVVRQIPIDLEGWNDLGYALAAIRWYAPFISVKASRAIHGLENLDLYDDPIQSDANGSAKITVIAIERSLLAWQVVRRRWPSLAHETIELMVRLRDVRAEMIRIFPHWHAFVRPGFDTEQPTFGELNLN